MLGVHYVPRGNGIYHIDAMKNKGDLWADRQITRPLCLSDAWLSFFLALYPGMSYGLESVLIAPKELDDKMQALYYKILPVLGVNRNISKEWRTLSERFQGLGLPNFVVDCLAAKLFYMQSVWGFDCAAGHMMMQAYEAFLIEVGLYGDTMQHSYKQYRGLATDGTWFKNLWQFLDELGITLETTSEVQLSPIREENFSLTGVIATGPFTEEEKASFNRCKNHKCVVRASYVVLCDGKAVEPSIMNNDTGE